MTNVVRGAGRARHQRNKRHNEQEKRVVGGNRDENLKAAADAVSPRKRAAAKKTAPKSDEPLWNSSDTLGANVHRLRELGVTWKRCGEMANENGHEMPWPDGGRLRKSMNQVLKGTEGKEPARPARRSGVQRSKAAPVEEGATYADGAEARLKASLKTREVPWDDDTPELDIIGMIEGHQITWVSKVSGNEASCRVVKSPRHTKIEHGKDGPYITFVSQDGPFMNISLSRIIRVGR